MQIDVFTLFPEWFEWFRASATSRNALAHGHELRCVNPRDHTPLSGGQVDDTPFGGGAGMVLRVDVMDAALRARYGVDPVDLRSAAPGDRADAGRPHARRALRRRARRRARADAAVRPLRGLRRAHRRALRLRRAVDRALRAGGGELAAMVVMRRGAAQAARRARPRGVSALEESFSAALEGEPEYPHYTRPAEYRGWKVPDVLLSGHHERIARRGGRDARAGERGPRLTRSSLP